MVLHYVLKETTQEVEGGWGRDQSESVGLDCEWLIPRLPSACALQGRVDCVCWPPPALSAPGSWGSFFLAFVLLHGSVKQLLKTSFAVLIHSLTHNQMFYFGSIIFSSKCFEKLWLISPSWFSRGQTIFKAELSLLIRLNNFTILHS